ncbi:DNA polymerase IV [Luteibaculum oceani]|uniref:DNA polymerase IV n=1 Tax=Luteibaculum oceani TaxID=1294296 RepID=A0A5C6VE88_9FLAO|nr:DNA polymerase IV [Luteibaculum oceani]TXC82105.1 DNA polymerase IV [Luteibaculum oceani]
MERAILHLDLDTFFVSCERLMDRKLHNRPVLIGGTSDRGVVASCSYEARTYGIHSGMPMRMARQLCPHAIVIRGNSGTYSKFSDMVTEIISENSPLYEKSSIDEFYVDFTGMDRFFGAYKWAQELREKIIKETHLPLSFALSINKTVSKVGTGLAKPNNHKQIIQGTEKPFLAPLSVKKIPMVGDQTYKMLRNMGVEKIYTVQQMHPDLLRQVMGKNGVSLWKKAQGIDNSPVIPYHERKSISIERTFEKDTTDTVKLKSIVTAMAENLAYQLRNGNKLTACVAVRIRYTDFQTYSKQMRIPYTSLDDTLIKTTLELFETLYSRRMLVRLVGVRFSHLVQGNYQMDLFQDAPKMLSLYQAMDNIRNRYGQDAVKRAVAMGSKAIGRSNPFNGQPPIIPAHRRA